MKKAGFLSLLHMLVLRVGPDPISPWLLLFAMLGHDQACVIDHPFMALVDPELYDSLAPWITHDRTKPIPTNPTQALFHILGAAGIDVSAALRNLSYVLSTDVLFLAHRD